MASVIKLKRSSSASAVPADDSLQAGELAINLADKKLFSARSNGQVITISGDQYNMTSSGNSTQGTVNLTVDNDALSNDAIAFVGTNGITVSGNSTQITIDSPVATDYDFATVANTSSANLVLGGDADTDTVKIEGDDHITVAAGNTSHVTVKLGNSVSVADVTTSGDATIGGDADISGEVNAATGAIVGDLTVGGDTDITGEVNAATGAIVGDLTVGGDTDITGEVNAATAAIVGDAAIGGDADITGEVNAATAAITTSLQIGTGDSVSSNSSTLTVGTDGGKISISNNAVKLGNSTVNTSITSTALHSDAAVDFDSTLNVNGVITAGDDVDISGEVNAATAAIVGNATVGGNMTITGDLTVSGTTTEVSSTTVTIDDGILSLADNQADTGTEVDSVDVGFYGVFGNSSSKTFHGIVRDQSANSYVVFNGISSEPTSTVSYTAANSSNSGDLGQLDAIIDGGTY